ncbi:MAG TPA: caspase family protein [Chitinophagaceae bacterium]|jgi:tetratricopeptide (TPR) repeat protein
MVRIEIELLGEKTQEDIYDLRNYLREQMPGADFVLKEQPALPGQMGGLIEPIINGLLHASSAIVFEEIYHNLLKPLYNGWLKARKQASSELQVMSSITNEGEKVHFVEDSSGRTEIYNFKYAIDTDKTFVLLIGSGKFSNDFNPIPPVKGNLEDFYKLLTDKRHIGIPRENIVVSFNETHVEIQKQLLQAARRQDVQTLLIYFAGHGHRSDVKKLSLIASDTEKIGDEVIGGIDFDFISSRVLKNSVAKQKILILDTCHSGIATQGSDDLTANFDVKGSYILTSSPGDDVSYFQKDARHTYFTDALLEILQNGIDSSNDMLALEDLYDYTKEILTEKKFPQPNAKSELNIPPSGFFIARNPSFSGDKLKWKAYNLFRDGKLEDALDEFRLLLKRFPADEELRRQFEACEAELSFSRLVHEANALFYGQKNYQKAVVLYRKAYQLKKDAMVMEKIRQCERQPGDQPVVIPVPAVKDSASFKAFQKAQDRKALYTACQYLKKLQQEFPGDSYVNEELHSLENKLQEMTDGRKDERLTAYYAFLDNGKLEQAQTELKTQLTNDPEYPVFLQLQKLLQWRIKEEADKEKEEKKPLLYRLFQTFGTRWKAIVLLLLAGVIATVIIYYVKGEKESKTSLSELKEMLTVNADKAIALLEERGKDNDSAKLILGDYYQERHNYNLAFSQYDKAALPMAKSNIAKMYYYGKLGNSPDTARAKTYFKKALLLGIDTAADLYIGFMELRKCGATNAGLTGSNPGWQEAMEKFKEGYANGNMDCKFRLGDMNFKMGDSLYQASQFDNAYSFLTASAGYDNSKAMDDLGGMFGDSTWRRSSNDSSEAWYKRGAALNNAECLNEYARFFMGRVKGDQGLANYDTAYHLLIRAKNIDGTIGPVYTNLGIVFDNGGVEISRSDDSAVYYYRKAAARGRRIAKDWLKKKNLPE